MSHIILIGKPGSGKGTISKKLLSNDNYVHLSTGDVFRKHIKDKTDLGLEIIDIMSSGELVNDELTIAVVEDFLLRNVGKNIIFDGFPRNIFQAEWLILNELENQDIEVLHMSVDNNLAIKRIQERSIIENRPEDSDITAISKRLNDYDNLTIPILEWCSRINVDIISINSSVSPDECYNEIVQKLNL